MGLGDRLSRRHRRGEEALNSRVTSARVANMIFHWMQTSEPQVGGPWARGVGRNNQKELLMGKGNKVRKKEIKKPKQDKKKIKK